MNSINRIISPEVNILEMHYLSMKNYNYLIVDTISKAAVIIDPAWQIEKIDDALKASGAYLSGVLITHSHTDHINLAEEVAQKYNCPIWMSEEEVLYSGFHSPRLRLIGSQPWSIEGLKIEPILTPGHTPGCICYKIGNNLFTGDVLFAEGCGVCPDEASAYEMFDSLNMLKTLIHPSVKIYPGHTYGKLPGQTFGHLLMENIYLQFKEKEMFSKFRLRPRQTRSKLMSFS